MTKVNVANTQIVYSLTRVSPYYNDYDESKNFYQIVFKPDYPVQARELTQLQTILQNQIERFGQHIFLNGSQVLGGEINFTPIVSINLVSTYANTDIDVSDFLNKKIQYTSNTDVLAQVVAVSESNASEPPTLHIRYLSGQEFSPSDTIKVSGENVFANLVSTANASSNGSLSYIQDSIYFVDGYFIKVPKQTLVVSKYSANNINAKIGLEKEKSIIKQTTDQSLLDPAAEASNYDAPGADRFKFSLTLSKRTLDSEDDEEFIELMRVENSILKSKVDKPLYAEIEETLARRTYDESGDYVVNPFILSITQSSNANNVFASVTPGKAYIRGYEFETISETNIEIPKARSVSNTIVDYDINMNYGNYVIVDSLRGLFDVSTMEMVDIHCVSGADVDPASANSYNSTKIGTGRVRDINFYGGDVDVDARRFEFYLFDTKFRSISANSDNTAANTTEVLLDTNLSSAINTAYEGVTIRILDGPGAGDVRTIASYDGVGKKAQVSVPFSAITTAETIYSLEFDFSSAESFVKNTTYTVGATTAANADINVLSKSNGLANGLAQITEASLNTLVFKYPDQFISMVSNPGYFYRRKFTGVQFTDGESTAIISDSGEDFEGATSSSNTSSTVMDNYLVVVTDKQGSSRANGEQIKITTTVSGDPEQTTFDTGIGAGDTFQAAVLAKMESTGTNERVKTLKLANSVYFATESASNTFVGTTGSNTSVYLTTGQILIRNPSQIPGEKESLYISDVIGIKKIWDLNGAGDPSANAVLGGFIDVTDRYELHTGQKDNYYDHASISLKSGFRPAKGPLVVCARYYSHTTDKGFFSVNSYPSLETVITEENVEIGTGYSIIPEFKSSTGEIYPLRSSIDFRPVRANGSNTTPEFTLNGVKVPIPATDFESDYQHYLGRYDLLVITINTRELKIIPGIPAKYPQTPKVPADALVLYRIFVPPYTIRPTSVEIKSVDNRRYTMKDIGLINKRLTNVEYYVKLNNLERKAYETSIRDSFGLERTKYGILTDNFVDHRIGDSESGDYKIAMDIGGTFFNGRATPMANTEGVRMVPDTLSNTIKRGKGITLSYTTEQSMVQPWATKFTAVADYMFGDFEGQIIADPESDIWRSNENPVVINNSTTSQTTSSQTIAQNTNNWFRNLLRSFSTPSQWVENPLWDIFNTTRTTVTNNLTQTTQVSDVTLGTNITDVSLIPQMRAVDISFTGYALRPTREVTVYFEGININKYFENANIVELDADRDWQDILEGGRENINLAGGTAKILHHEINANTGNTFAYIQSIVNPTTNVHVGNTFTGVISGLSANVVSYQHRSGFSRANSNSSHIFLSLDANRTTDNLYVGNVITILSGSWSGLSSNIVSYNAASQLAIVSPVFPATATLPVGETEFPDEFFYTIGDQRSPYSSNTTQKIYTTQGGFLSGVFHLPDSRFVSDTWTIGEKILRILDNNTNNINEYTTRADFKFSSYGLNVERSGSGNDNQEQIIPRPRWQPILQSRDLGPLIVAEGAFGPVGLQTPGAVAASSYNAYLGMACWTDPIAQTFYVDPIEFPQGKFIESISVFFKSKSDIMPVEMQIRPCIEGDIPSPVKVLPGAVKVLLPEEVNVSDLPDTSNNSTKTTFTFPHPVFVEPDKVYAFVILTNSFDYDIYVSELGEKIIGSDRIVSKQPNNGSLFKSQNSRLYTALQNEDIMFEINKCVFETSGSVTFKERKSDLNITGLRANTYADMFYLRSDLEQVDGTRIVANIKTTSNTTGTMDSTYEDIGTDENHLVAVRKVVYGELIETESVDLKFDLFTENTDISPVIYHSRQELIAIENIINNMPVTNNDIFVVSGGTGYTAANTNVLITGQTGQGANGFIQANVSTGAIESIIMDAEGSGYFDNVEVVITSSDGSGANVVVNHELNNAGGLAKARYITKPVTLKDGFDAGDLRLQLTVIKPQSSNVAVYYRVRNALDPNPIQDLNWKRMSMETSEYVYSLNGEPIEFEFRPSLTANSISYQSAGTTYTTFNQFQIKIALSAPNTLVQNSPNLIDLRAIALPGDEF